MQILKHTKKTIRIFAFMYMCCNVCNVCEIEYVTGMNKIKMRANIENTEQFAKSFYMNRCGDAVFRGSQFTTKTIRLKRKKEFVFALRLYS